MPNYYLDTEFAEGIRKPIWWLPTIGSLNKPRWHIDLISIGLVCDDGREYEAFNKEFNPRYANDWVKKNVLAKLPQRVRYEFGRDEFGMSEQTVAFPIRDGRYKSLEQIAKDIAEFTGCGYDDGFWYAPSGIVFYAYFADYDWIMFCSLFGSMMGLPKGYPMYCRDLKQELDDIAIGGVFVQTHPPKDFDDALKMLKQHRAYPQQVNEHSALADARWNQLLHNFIQHRVL